MVDSLPAVRPWLAIRWDSMHRLILHSGRSVSPVVKSSSCNKSRCDGLNGHSDADLSSKHVNRADPIVGRLDDYPLLVVGDTATSDPDERRLGIVALQGLWTKGRQNRAEGGWATGQHTCLPLPFSHSLLPACVGL